MTVTRIPLPPAALEKLSPELHEFLMQLVSDIQGKLNDLDNSAQQTGRNIRLPLIVRADAIGGLLKIRPKDYPVMAYCPSLLDGDPALLITDGTNVRAITIGPAIS